MRQASLVEYEPEAVEIAVLEDGKYRQLSEAEVKRLVQRFLELNPIVKDEDDSES